MNTQSSTAPSSLSALLANTAIVNQPDFRAWLDARAKREQRHGQAAWRGAADEKLYDAALMRQHTESMANLRAKGQGGDAGSWLQLVDVLQQYLYRHVGEVNNPQMYNVSQLGTKVDAERLLTEARECILALAREDVPGFNRAEKHAAFDQARRNYGETALLLSGGMAFGIYHTGVTKALFEANLLPQIISGSSMGSIVAAGICTRSDEELIEFYRDPGCIHHKALRYHKPARIIQDRLVYDPTQLREHIAANVADMTFAQAYEHSGRILNITVSPTRAHQKPRVLNHKTAPNVLVHSAALASCAIPGAFAPVQLRRRVRGVEKPYMDTETWIDGSVYSDIPAQRMARLLNVNHSIVSQANPVVLPFVTHRKGRGPIAFAKHAASSALHVQAAEVLEAARNIAPNAAWRPLLDKAFAVARQTYLGDINICFPFNPLMYRKVAKNPDFDDLLMFIRLGEQATWPHLAAIYWQTLMHNTFDEADRIVNA